MAMQRARILSATVKTQMFEIVQRFTSEDTMLPQLLTFQEH